MSEDKTKKQTSAINSEKTAKNEDVKKEKKPDTTEKEIKKNKKS